MSETIAAVVVTYNRKDLLRECLNSILAQNKPLNALFIIDNHSTDGTPQYLKELGFIPEVLEANTEPAELYSTVSSSHDTSKEIKTYYIRMHENTGSAGGFHEGIKRAYEKGYDLIWVMDDDGKAKSNTLEKLIQNVNNDEAVLHPLVLDEDEKVFSFGCWLNLDMKNEILLKTIDEFNTYLQDKKINNNMIFSLGTPFNGTLIPRKIIKTVGYPNPKYFIWGDESEYIKRIVKSGFKSFIVLDAFFIHPHNPLIYSNLQFAKNEWWKLYYQYRNRKEIYYLSHNKFIATLKYIKQNMTIILSIMLSNQKHKYFKIKITCLATLHALIGKYGRYDINKKCR